MLATKTNSTLCTTVSWKVYLSFCNFYYVFKLLFGFYDIKYYNIIIILKIVEEEEEEEEEGKRRRREGKEGKK